LTKEQKYYNAAKTIFPANDGTKLIYTQTLYDFPQNNSKCILDLNMKYKAAKLKIALG
jgi:hypothetical protein